MTRPHCYNRQPFTGQWLRNGWCPRTLKVRLRWVAHRMSDRCAAWDLPPGGSVPGAMLHGWDCAGCRWLPPRASHG